MNYEEAVTEAKAIVARMEKDTWRLAAIVFDLEPKYGEQTLERFAGEVGLSLRTIQTYRQMYERFGRSDPQIRSNCAFWTLNELINVPEADKLIEAHPNMTQVKARELARNVADSILRSAIEEEPEPIEMPTPLEPWPETPDPIEPKEKKLDPDEEEIRALEEIQKLDWRIAGTVTVMMHHLRDVRQFEQYLKPRHIANMHESARRISKAAEVLEAILSSKRQQRAKLIVVNKKED